MVQRVDDDSTLLIRAEPAMKTIEAVERLPLLSAPLMSEDVALAVSREEQVAPGTAPRVG